MVSKLLMIYLLSSLLHTTSLVAGFRFRVTSSKCLISEPPGSLFFFCFNMECQLVRLWMTCALIWSCMNQWLLFSTIHTYQSNASDSAARRCSEQRLNLAVLMQQSPLSRRRLLTEVLTLERSRGTRQLRNLCKDAIEIPHTLANIELPVAHLRFRLRLD